MRKLKDVKHAIPQDVKLYGRELYIKVTERSLTMWDSTDEVRWRTLQLASFLVQQIGVGNPHVINTLIRWFT
jgi:hypothetical protein